MTLEVADFWERSEKALEVAHVTIGIDPDTAASKAYFAAFYAFSALFAARGKTFASHGGVEVAVHGELIRSGILPKEIGAHFGWLASLRHLGDYGGGNHVTTQDAELAISRASAIVEALKPLIEWRTEGK